MSTRAKQVRTLQPIYPPTGPSRGRKVYKYTLVAHEGATVTWYTLRRTHAGTAAWWAGPDNGWVPEGNEGIRQYTRPGAAYSVLRRLQKVDSAAARAARRRNQLAALAPRMLAVLRLVRASAGESVAPEVLEVLEQAERIGNDG